MRNNINKTKKISKNSEILSKYSYLFFLCFSLFYSEMILRMNITESFWGIGIAYSFLFSLFTSLIIYLVLSFFTGSFLKVLSIGANAILAILFCSQLIYYKIFLTFYSLFSAQKGGQVLEFIPEIVAYSQENIFWLLLLLLPLVLSIVFYKRIKIKFINNYTKTTIWKQKAYIILMSILIFFGTIISIQNGDRGENSPYEMYYVFNHPIYSVMDLGLLTTFRLDVKRSVFGFEDDNSENATSTDETSNSESNSLPDITPKTTNSTSNSNITPDATPTNPSEYNVLDIDFDELNKNTSDKNIISLNNYFKKLQPTAKNDYTGKFKDYNLILITAEGFSRFAVDKNVTPTLYMMSTEGFNFTNFYNPVWGVSTSDGEYVATTGLIPKSGVWSMLKSGSNAMPFVMGNQLKSLGYKTVAFHNHSYKYYGRDISHPNMGYIYKGVGNGLDVKKTWPESDLEMMEKSINDYIDSSKFHAYYMTVSGHLRYNFTGNFIAKKNKPLVDNLPYSEAGRAYMATQIELDRAMKYLLQKLEEKGVAQKTLIVISADHYPYGLKKEDLDNLAGHEVENNFELYKSSLIIYSKGMTPQKIERPVSSLDIIPTISNLLGLDFDSRLFMGIDCFSDTPPLVIFSNRSFICDSGKYNAYTKVITPNNGKTLDKTYQSEISNKINDKFHYSAKILDTNYYGTLEQK